MNHSMQASAFWQSRFGIALIVFLVIAAVLLGYEHRVHILGGNSGSVLFILAWVGLHFFMHRGHGGHAGHGSSRNSESDANKKLIETGGEKP